MSESLETSRIAEFITQSNGSSMPQQVLDLVKVSVLDYLGVALVGANETLGRIVTRYAADAGGQPEAGVIGGGFRTSVTQAAWVNGATGHAIDYDDYSMAWQTHPSVVILPAILALAEKYHAPGRELLTSYAVGFEVGTRVYTKGGKRQFELGWHTTSTIGSLAASAAASNLLKLDVQKTRQALGIAASLASGLRQNFGTMTKPLHAGSAARNGVLSAMLAERGFTGAEDILDGPLGFNSVFCGGSRCESVEPPGASHTGLSLVHPGIGVKAYPSSAGTHWAIDAALKLKRAYDIQPDEVASIECRCSSALPSILIHSRPETGLQARFSLEYCVAAAISDGAVSLKQFTQERVIDPDLKKLVTKVRYAHPAEMGKEVSLSGEVVVELKDGRVLSQVVEAAEGEPKNPISWERLSDKFRDCARTALTADDTETCIHLVSRLESMKDVSEIMAIVTLGKP